MSYRMLHKVWLDLHIDVEAALIEELALRKQRRQYTASIRDGLRLLFSLQEGDTSVLFELFPELEGQIQSSTGGGGVSQDDIDRLERLILARGAESGMVMQPGSAKQIAAPEFDAPVFEEDDLDMFASQEITGHNKRVAKNFLNSIQGLQQ